MVVEALGIPEKSVPLLSSAEWNEMLPGWWKGQEVAKLLGTELLRWESDCSECVLFFSGVCLRAHSLQNTGPNWAELWPKRQVWALLAPVNLGLLVTADLSLWVRKQGRLWGRRLRYCGPHGSCSGYSTVLCPVLQSLKRKEKEYEHEMERLAREKIATQQRLAELKHELSQWMDVLEIDRVLRQTGQPEDDQASTSTASGELHPSNVSLAGQAFAC